MGSVKLGNLDFKATSEVSMDRKLYLMGAVILAALLFMLPGAGYADPARIGAITDAVTRPACVALDSQGNIYVSETAGGMLKVYSRKGKLLKQLSVPRPLGVAVDASGYIYVGSATKHAVDIYAPDYTYVRSLGAGPGEIDRPMSIAVDSAGKVYVLDGATSMVRIYDASTALLSSFGGSGSTDGLFNKPTALAVSDAANEIYVADLRKTLVISSGAYIDGAKIQVFDKTGAFKRSFGDYGTEAGKIGKPVNMAFDGSGNIFILDLIQGAALSFDATAGTFNNNALYKAESSKPLGIAIGKNKIVYVSLDNSNSIDVYGLDGFTTMDEAPAALTFESKQLSANAQAKTVAITNAGNGSLGWTVGADSDWITLGATAGTAGPNSSSSLAVGTNNANLKAGTYQGVVTVTSDFGQIDRIPVALTVTPAATIGFSNGSVTVAAKKDKTPAAQPITIDVQNAYTLSWSASSDSPWLGISPANGTATTASALSINMTNMAPGTYTGHITLSAPGAIGDGSKMTVSLNVTQGTKISVTTNIPEAKFTVAGAAASYMGSGTTWSVEDAPLGDYTVTFDAVGGYRKPLSQTKSLIDADIAVSGNYLSLADIASRTNIIVGREALQNNGSRIKFYKNDGTPATDMMASSQNNRYVTNVASADIDGDGFAELIVESLAGANKPSIVRVLKSDGTTLLEFAPYTTSGRVNVAAGDLNGDGKAEIVVAPAADTMNAPVKVYTFKADTKEMAPTGIALTAFGYDQAVAVAVADTTGNAAPKLVTASQMVMSVWTIDASKGTGSWTASLTNDFKFSSRGNASLSTGDVDGDGKDEIIAGEGAGVVKASSYNAASKVMIFKTDGTQVGGFVPFANFPYGLSVAAADLTGDGIAEVIVGSGVDQRPAGRSDWSKVRIFNASGKLSNTITPYANSQGGVNVTAGEMGL
jgi:sugar lactone lactonase YvrE